MTTDTMGSQRDRHLSAALAHLHLWGNLLSLVIHQPLARICTLPIAMTPLQRFYLPYYLRTGVAGIDAQDGQVPAPQASETLKSGTRAPTETDVQEGSTASAGG